MERRTFVQDSFSCEDAKKNAERRSDVFRICSCHRVTNINFENESKWTRNIYMFNLRKINEKNQYEPAQKVVLSVAVGK